MRLFDSDCKNVLIKSTYLSATTTTPHPFTTNAVSNDVPHTMPRYSLIESTFIRGSGAKKKSAMSAVFPVCHIWLVPHFKEGCVPIPKFVDVRAGDSITK